MARSSSSSSSSSSSGGPVVEVWRDFGVWPVTESGPVGVLDRVAALRVAVEVAAVSDADQATSTREAAEDDADAAAEADVAAEAAASDAEAADDAEADAAVSDAEAAVSGGVWESGLGRVVSAWWLASCPGWVSAQ
ncbi:MAG TPA: hypothetical protein PLB21_09500, partial [Actinomycetota bacterium]|nr:hypothetical protein [Actinomycetota bacterium]